MQTSVKVLCSPKRAFYLNNEHFVTGVLISGRKFLKTIYNCKLPYTRVIRIQYDSIVVNYNRKLFISQATGDKENKNYTFEKR